MRTSDTHTHPLSLEELAVTVRSMRRHMAWSQEALASLAGLTVLNLQRMEAGQPSSDVDKRAVAGAFGWPLGFFGEIHAIPTDEELKAHVGFFNLTHIFLEAIPIDAGGIVACLSEAKGCAAMAPCSLAELPMIAQDALDALAKYVHSRLDSICSKSRREAQLHSDALTALADRLLEAGYQMYAAIRPTMVSNPAWPDPTPIPLTVLYIIAAPVKHILTQVAVKRQIAM